MSKINCFLPFTEPELWSETVKELNACELVNRVYLIGRESPKSGFEDCGFIKIDNQFSTDTIRKINGLGNFPYPDLHSRQPEASHKEQLLEHFAHAPSLKR